MKVSFYLARPTITNTDGEKITNPNQTVIFARICYSGYKMVYYTPESIHPKYWNGTAKPHRAVKTAKFPEYPEFNRRLDNIEVAIKDTIRKWINDNDQKVPTPDTIRPLLDIAVKDGGKVEKMTFMRYMTEYIAKCKTGEIKHAKTGKALTEGTIRSYETTKFNIERYITDTRNHVDFDSINIDFYTSFTEYLETEHTTAVNTIGKHIKVIKSFLNSATEEKHNTNLAYKSKRFITVSEEADTVYLTESELKKIEGLDLTEDKKLDQIRDLFLIGCYTGLRFSDLSSLRPDQIKGNMITITQIKTGEPVVIPVHDTVKVIMSKYSGTLPEAISNQKTNDYIKDVAKLCKPLKSLVSVSRTAGGELVTKTVPKHDLISTHTARRSFASNEYLAGTPVLTIMAITGHKTEKAFLKYIRITPTEHATILGDIWESRKTGQTNKIAI